MFSIVFIIYILNIYSLFCVSGCVWKLEESLRDLFFTFTNGSCQLRLTEMAYVLHVTFRSSSYEELVFSFLSM